jgi:hypothetical protein
MSTIPSQRNLALLLEQLDIPDSAYQRADRRYRSLGEFFASARAQSARHSPHIFPQGSFRLGTVIRPLDDGEYDIDIGCRLREGVSKSTHTQAQLKALIGADMERYRADNGIQAPLDEKRRCWRVAYQDELAFHMDVVPSIPEGASQRQSLQERMQASGVDPATALRVAQHAGAITDNTLPNYRQLSPDWKVSNSEGFALWFETRMRQARVLLEQRAAQAGTTIDRLPAREWNSPLQAVVRILKRHRDVMYRGHIDSQPISVIITTLAALAYGGESDLESALDGVLERMGSFVRPVVPRVPNPVNPQEDFADKWRDPDHAHLHLEHHFFGWLAQAQADFAALRGAATVAQLQGALGRFDVSPGQARLLEALGAAASVVTPATVEPTTRPWCG